MRRLLVLLFLAGCVTTSSQRAPEVWGDLRPGGYGVGYRVEEKDVSVWYPADPGGTPVTLGDYTADEEWPRATPMFAVRDARPVRGRYPVVLIAQGNQQDAAAQAVLAEYLASSGFIVATTPSPMIATPMTGTDEVATFAEKQADDLDRALEAVRGVRGAATTELAVIGHSFGARAALLFAMRRGHRLAALVSLDGGIGTATAVDVFRSARSFDPAADLPPILHLYEENDEFMKPDFALLRSLRPQELVLEKKDGLRHAHFTTRGFLIPEKRAEAASVARATLAYLGRYVRLVR